MFRRRRGIFIANELEALHALSAVLEWAQREPNHKYRGDTTGVTYQRDRIVATRVLPEETIGVSTYNSREEAFEKAREMERAYRAWAVLRDRGATA